MQRIVTLECLALNRTSYQDPARLKEHHKEGPRGDRRRRLQRRAVKRSPLDRTRLIIHELLAVVDVYAWLKWD